MSSSIARLETLINAPGRVFDGDDLQRAYAEDFHLIAEYLTGDFLNDSQVLFGKYLQDSALYWDNTNKRLGIGTTNPSHPLDVVGNMRSSANMGSATGTIGTGSSVSPNANTPLVLSSDGSARARIFFDNTSTGDSQLTFAGNGSTKWSAGWERSSGNFVITDNFSLSTNDRFHITTAGDVGIGEDNPAAKLHVVGSIRGGNSGSFELLGSGGEVNSIRAAGTKDLTFRADSTDVMKINGPTGQVSIGTTDPDFNYVLTLVTRRVGDGLLISANGTTNSPHFALNDGTNTITSYGLALNDGNFSAISLDGDSVARIVNGLDNNRLIFSNQNSGDIIFTTGSSSTNDTEKVIIKSDGKVGIGTTSPTSLLDIDSNTIRLRTSKTPSSATDTGNAGDIAWDSDYIYVCVATDTWKRSALSSW